MTIELVLSVVGLGAAVASACICYRVAKDRYRRAKRWAAAGFVAGFVGIVPAVILIAVLWDLESLWWKHPERNPQAAE